MGDEITSLISHYNEISTYKPPRYEKYNTLYRDDDVDMNINI